MADGTLLLDTCALIWLANDDPLSDPAVQAIEAEIAAGRVLLVSLISAWEWGLLTARSRIVSAIEPRSWFAAVMARAELSLAPLAPEVLIDSSFLPGRFHKDPADRIIVATARALHLTVVTRDRMILDYAAQGHVRALAC